MTLWSAAVLALGSVAGCAASTPSRSGSQATVSLLVPPEELSVMGAPVRLNLVAERVCADAACTGRGYYLSVVNAMGREMYIQYAPVRLLVNGRTVEWLANDRDEETMRPAVGAFVRVPLDERTMRELVAAPSAVLSLGSTRLPLARAQLAALGRIVPASE